MMASANARWLMISLAVLLTRQICLADTSNIEKITVFPTMRILEKGGSQRLAVIAHFAGGGSKDVTRRARFTSTDDRIAGVDRTGLVSAFNSSGEAWILIHFQNKVARFRARVASGEPVPAYQFPHQTLVDRHTHHQWKRLGLLPSGLCTDEEFIRRTTVQLTGLLPTPNEIIEFTKSPDPSKRDKWVDRLLASKEHHAHFANLWADALRIPRVSDVRKAYEPLAFYKWIHDSVAKDKPLDRFIEELLESSGNATTAPQVQWYAALQQPVKLAEDSAQVFLGTNLRCIKCHDHPYENWKRENYWGLAAFFAQTRITQIPNRGKLRALVPAAVPMLWQVTRQPHVRIHNPVTRTHAIAALLDSGPLQFSFREDPRRLLTEWVHKETEPNFARATVNRYWAYFFGKGIVDPPDDLRYGNPPANPELLDALTKDFIDHHYSVKHLLQTICKSRTYQLGSQPSDSNADDARYFSRFYQQPMRPGMLHDTVTQITKTHLIIKAPKGLEIISGRSACFRDIEFRSRLFNPFLESLEGNDCERDIARPDHLKRARELFSFESLQAKFTQAGGWADQLAKDPRPDQLKIDDVFLWILSKRPTIEQKDSILQFIKGNESNKAAAYQQLIATLARTKEFLMIR